MPHHLVSCGIVGFWLGTMGVLVLREWHQRQTAPPSLMQTIPERTTEPVQWRIFRCTRGPDGHWEEPFPIGVLISQIQRDEQSNLVSIIHQLELDIGQLWHHLPLPESTGALRLESRLEVGLFGEMQRLRIVGGWSTWARWLILLDIIPRLHDQAMVRWMINLPTGVWRQEYTVPWAVKSLPINSLGPPDRLPPLRPGQRWALPWVDVLGWSGVPGGFNEASVTPKPVALTWQGENHPCLVVRLKRPPLEVQWWVAQETNMQGWVLQQIVRWSDTQLLLVRQTQVTRHDLLIPPSWFYRMP